MEFAVAEPEVAGALGARTVMDTSVHPPNVSRLHYELEGWLGDSILESFPCFVATADLADAVDAAGFSGVHWDDVEVSTSPQFQELYPGRTLPEFRWMRVTGIPRLDDFGLAIDNRLVVSDRALGVLRAAGLRHALVEE